MICFGIKTDQEVKENGHVGPTLKKKNHKGGREEQRRAFGFYIFFYYFIFLLSLISSFHGVPITGSRRDKHGKCSTRRGLRVSTKNIEFYLEFR